MKVRYVPAFLLLAASLVLPISSLVVPKSAEAGTLPNLSVSNSSILEGDTGLAQASVEITLSKPSSTPVTVAYTTKDIYGSAYNVDEHGAAKGVALATTTGGDYIITQNQSLVFDPGQVQKTVRVPIIGNERVQPNHLFSVDVTSAVGATVIDGSGTVTIIDDDVQPSYFRLGIGDVSMREPTVYGRVAYAVINFSDPAPRSFNLTVSTADATAFSGVNYASKSAVIPVAAGTKSKTIPIAINPNTVIDGTKYFYVNITSDYGLMMRNRAKIEIRDAQATYSRTGRRAGPPRIALVGDSVTANYQEVAKQLFEKRGFQVYKYGFPGRGLLDADWCKGQLADAVMSESDPDVVVFESMGNYGFLFAKCYSNMDANTPEFNKLLKSVVKLYDTKFTANGANVYWVQAPSVRINDPQYTERLTTILYLNSLYPGLTITNPKSHVIDAYTPFGGNPPDCSLRDHGIFAISDCLHLNVAGEKLFSNVVNNGVKL